MEWKTIMPYELLVYNQINWKLQGTAQQDEIDRLTAKYSGAALEKALSIFDNKCDNCHTYGDIIQVFEWGRCTEAPTPNSRYYIVKVSTGDYETAKDRSKPIIRDFQYERTLNDEINHIYEYRVWVEEAIYNFKPNEYVHLPVDASLLSKTSTEVNIQLLPLTHPSVIAGDQTAIERRNEFQQNAKTEIHNLECMLLRHRYRIQLENLPPAIKTQLENDRWITVTQAQLLPYLEDKLG
jgi:hypothetical protein